MRHSHRTELVREFERSNPPSSTRYVVFLGESPKDGFFYCPKCDNRNPGGRTLGTILFNTLRISGTTRAKRRERFRESYWLLDMFGSEVRNPNTIEYERIEMEVAGLRIMMLELKDGHLPGLIIPAMRGKG